MTIDDYRKAIDAVDDEIVAALLKRVKLTDEVRRFKSREGLPAKDAAREQAIVGRMLVKTPAAERDLVAGIYERIFGSSRGFVETVARGVCFREGKLLVCRSKGGKSCYLPGGHIEFGELGSEALAREVKEETGAEASVQEFLGVVENSFVQAGKPHSEINLIYRFQIAPEVKVAALEPWLEFDWIVPNDLVAAGLLPTSIHPYCNKSGRI